MPRRGWCPWSRSSKADYESGDHFGRPRQRGTGTLSPNHPDEGQAPLRLSEDEAILSQIEVEHIKAQIERHTIRSPVDGVATRVRRRPGEFLPSSEPVIADLNLLG